MFSKIAEFFIKNSKLTFVLVLITIFAWVWSYIVIPKQYNPTIIVPAFQIVIEAPNLNSEDTKKLLLDPLEDKIMELEWIDEVFWTAWDNFIAVMAKFEVWIEKEKAKIRLAQKISENKDLQPIWVMDPIIKSIDPDDLPQITYIISYKNNNWVPLNSLEQSIYLWEIANKIKKELRKEANITTLDIIWAKKKDISIDIDRNLLEAKNIDILQVYDIIKKNNLWLPAWDIINKNEKIFVETYWNLTTPEMLKNLIVLKTDEWIVTLWDIADINYWRERNFSYTTFWDKNWLQKTAVLLWVWKKIWTNSVFVTEKIKEKIEEIKKELPKNIEIQIIQDEWESAKEATSELITDLIESIIIVVVILIIFLGLKNALNTATSIPLILSLVFVYAYIMWENINRITLFALILVIWMLVDDSIVVVENIHRHLEERVFTGKSKLESILNSVNEVWPWVIISTITKILAFASMFAVTGMMGEYMWPIPKFAIIALIFSIFIAFSINPWVSFLLTKDLTEANREKHEKKESKYDIRKFYLKLMTKYINSDNLSAKKRKKFKLIFWISLVLIIIIPVYSGVFKARMLPKSNKDQVYLWIDWVRSDTADNMLPIEKDIEKFFIQNSSLPKELQITKNISTTIGTPFMGDFANLFRWWSQRFAEYNISTRINLVSAEEDKKRIKSEEFAIKIRPYLRNYLLKKYPDIKIRLLEDPPGPPVRATFLIKTNGTADIEGLQNFTNKIYSEVKKIQKKHDIVDLWTSFDSTYKKISIELNHDSLIRAWLSVEQVQNTLGIMMNWVNIWIIKNAPTRQETNIVFGVKEEQLKDIQDIKNIKFTNSLWVKIPLYAVSNVKYDFVSSLTNTDNRKISNYIYAEMWDNSVVYPIIELYRIFKSKKFLWNEYTLVSSWPYKIQYLNKIDWKTYNIEWDWEWKLTMDTFKDLWVAMIIAILAIYFLIVGQFRSFKVAWIIMLPFLLGFYGIFPWFSILYLLKNEYFNATWMIGIISLAWIVVWNAILLMDYVEILKKRWWTIEKAILEAWYIRFMPIMLTSLSAIFWAVKITSDPVWSWLAWSIVWGLTSSAILTLIAIPIFYYDSQKDNWE